MTGFEIAKLGIAGANALGALFGGGGGDEGQRVGFGDRDVKQFSTDLRKALMTQFNQALANQNKRIVRTDTGPTRTQPSAQATLPSGRQVTFGGASSSAGFETVNAAPEPAGPPPPPGNARAEDPLAARDARRNQGRAMPSPSDPSGGGFVDPFVQSGHPPPRTSYPIDRLWNPFGIGGGSGGGSEGGSWGNTPWTSAAAGPARSTPLGPQPPLSLPAGTPSPGQSPGPDMSQQPHEFAFQPPTSSLNATARIIENLRRYGVY